MLLCYNDIDKRKPSRAWIVPKTEDKNAFNVEENATDSVKHREMPDQRERRLSSHRERDAAHQQQGECLILRFLVDPQTNVVYSVQSILV